MNVMQCWPNSLIPANVILYIMNRFHLVKWMLRCAFREFIYRMTAKVKLHRIHEYHYTVFAPHSMDSLGIIRDHT